MDAIAQFKENAKQAWSTFAALEMSTASGAPALVSFAGIRSGDRVLDVACGTGVVALTAARRGAQVTGIDLTPELVDRARENAAIIGLEAVFEQGDVEALPLADAAFDVVVSQFGHMFAPRPAVAIDEMLRVLKPGGRVAFATWPPQFFIGKLFAILGRYAPPPPPDVPPSIQWGDPAVIRERLGDGVRDLVFGGAALQIQTLSVPHFRLFLESHLGNLAKLVANLEASDPDKLSSLRREIDEAGAPYFADNHLREDYLLTRAIKR